MRMRLLVGLSAAALAFTFASQAGAQSAQTDYTNLCSSCHTANFRLPSGGSIAGRNLADLASSIRGGLPLRGMPAFGNVLSDARINAIVRLIHAPAGSSMTRAVVEAETLDRERSAGYVIRTSEREPQRRFLGHVGQQSWLCYDNVDMTGVRSIELNYSRGQNDEPGRFAIVVGDGRQRPRVNLGEHVPASTGDWETYGRQRLGLNRELSGPQLLCFYGVSGGGIFNLDSFALSDQPAAHEAATLQFSDQQKSELLNGAGYRFTLERVAEADSEVWSMAFLPDGSILTAQKNGQLLLFKGDGARVGAVQGIPRVWNGGQGGLLAVKPHPDYAKNGWIYLTFSDPAESDEKTMTRVVRGKLDGLRWIEQQDIYRAPAQFYAADYAHFGSRIAFAGGYMYFGIGDRQQMERAQDLGYPFGKIHRLHDDGRVPKDNPFVGRADALPSIWSYGHRNPQGMTAHPRTGAIWSAEHGARGGDEVNLVRKGANYGWPRVSFGTHYDLKPVGDSPYAEGIEPPVHYFVPSIGLSQIQFYYGDKFPEWQGQLFVASLGKEELHLVRLRDDRVMNQRLVFKGRGRIRDVVVGPDGYPYVLLNQVTHGVYRLRPSGE